MNINLEKAISQANSIREISDYTEVKPTLKDFSETVYYYDDENAKPSADLKENENYLGLMDYLADAHNVVSAVMTANFSDEKEEKVDDFISSISDTETDLLTYLDNFVNDDTSYADFRTYLLEDFENVQAFALQMMNGYFHNNFIHYLKKIG